MDVDGFGVTAGVAAKIKGANIASSMALLYGANAEGAKRKWEGDKHPNSNLQAPEKLQYSNGDVLRLSWALGLSVAMENTTCIS